MLSLWKSDGCCAGRALGVSAVCTISTIGGNNRVCLSDVFELYLKWTSSSCHDVPRDSLMQLLTDILSENEPCVWHLSPNVYNLYLNLSSVWMDQCCRTLVYRVSCSVSTQRLGESCIGCSDFPQQTGFIHSTLMCIVSSTELGGLVYSCVCVCVCLGLHYVIQNGNTT